MKVLIVSEVDFSSHHGIRRKYTTLRRCLTDKSIESEIIHFNSSNKLDRLGMFYLRGLFVINNFDVLYVRNNTRISSIFSYTLLLFISTILKKRILVEVPTWPFINEEYSGFTRFVKRFILEWNLFIYRLHDTEILLCSPNVFKRSLRWHRITNWIPDLNLSLESAKSVSFNDKWDYVYVANLDKWHDPSALISKVGESSKTLLIIAPKPPNKELATFIDTYSNIDFRCGLSETELFWHIFASKVGIDSTMRKNGNYSLKSRDYLACGISLVYFHDDDFLMNLTSCTHLDSFDCFNPNLDYSSKEMNKSAILCLKTETVFNDILW